MTIGHPIGLAGSGRQWMQGTEPTVAPVPPIFCLPPHIGKTPTRIGPRTVVRVVPGAWSPGSNV